MKLDLNLSTAFTLRKRINKLACDVRAKVYTTNPLVEAEEVETVQSNYITGNIDTDITLYNVLCDATSSLSNEIEKFNVSGKCIMNKIQKLNEKVALIEHILVYLNANPVRKERNPITGNWETRKLEKLSTIDYSKKLNELAQEKIHLEDELAKINSSTTFTFDLSDEIYHLIYG